MSICVCVFFYFLFFIHVKKNNSDRFVIGFFHLCCDKLYMFLKLLKVSQCIKLLTLQHAYDFSHICWINELKMFVCNTFLLPSTNTIRVLLWIRIYVNMFC